MTTLITNPVATKLHQAFSPKQAPVTPRFQGLQGYGLTQDTVELNHSKAAAPASSVRFGARAAYEGPFEQLTIITDFGDGKSDGLSNARVENRLNQVLEFVSKNRRWNPDIAGVADVKEPKLPRPTGFASAMGNQFRQSDYKQQLRQAQERKLLGFQIAPWTYDRTKQGVREKEYKPGVLDKRSISDIHGGNIDYAARALLELAFEDPSKNNLFVHVIDPGVGADESDHDRSILVTQNNGIFIGPNNGSLGLVAQRLRQQGEEPRILQIDFDKVQDLERIRLNDPKYEIGSENTFHGRDLLAVVGGAIAGGIDPEALATRAPDGKVKLLEPVLRPFSQTAETLPQPGETKTILALRDKTHGNLKLNIPLDKATFRTLLGTQFEVYNPVKDKWVEATVHRRFKDAPAGDVDHPAILLGSSATTQKDKQRLELVINLGRAAQEFGIGPDQAAQLLIRRPA